jgi:plasmid stabilization system protein ParE
MEDFKVIVSPRAQQEIEQAIDFYALRSKDAPAKMISSLQAAYAALATNPFFAVRYKNIRSLKLYKFPFSLYFIVKEAKQEVKVLSCFHNKRSPQQQPKK